MWAEGDSSVIEIIDSSMSNPHYSQLIKLRQQKKTKTADLQRTSCKLPCTRSIANQEKLTQSLSLVNILKKERTLKSAKTSLKPEKPSRFPLGTVQSLESELAEVKANYEILLDDKAHLSVTFEKERTLMIDEIHRVETLLQKERCYRLSLQEQLKSEIERAPILNRSLTHNQKCLLAPKITSLSDSLLSERQSYNRDSISFDSLPREPLSLKIKSSKIYMHGPILDDRDRPNRYCCEGFQMERQIRDEINSLKESILSLKHENQLLKLDATSMKSQLALLQAPDIDCLFKEDDQSISNEASLNQKMSESLDMIPLENIIVSNENAHLMNIGMKSCDVISFKMMQSIEDVDKAEWMGSESIETQDLPCQDSSLLNSEFPFMIQRNLDKYDILLKAYEHLKREYETLEKSYTLTSNENQCLLNDLELCKQKEDSWTEKIDQLLLHLRICQGEISELLEDKTNLSNKIRKLEERQQALLAQIENIQKSCHNASETDKTKIEMFSKETQIIPDDHHMRKDFSGKVELLGIKSEDFKASCEYLKDVVMERDVFIETNNPLQSLNSQLESQKHLLLLQELDELRYYSNCLASSLYENSEKLSILQDHCKSIRSKNRIFETKNDVLQKECDAISLKYAEVCNLNEKAEILNAKHAAEIKLLKGNIMKLSLENESLSSFSNYLLLQIADLSIELKENKVVLTSKCSLVTELNREIANFMEIKRKYEEDLKILRVEMLSIKSCFLIFKDLHNSMMLCAKEHLEELNQIFNLRENEMIELKKSASAMKCELEKLSHEKNIVDLKNFEIQNQFDALSGEIKTLENKLSGALQDNHSLRCELIDLKKSTCASEEESKKLVSGLNACNCELEQKLRRAFQEADAAKVTIESLNHEITKSIKNYESKVVELEKSRVESDLANDSLRRLESDHTQLLLRKEQVSKENAELLEKIDFLNNELESAITRNKLFERDSRTELESMKNEKNGLENELKTIITEMGISSKLLSDLKVQNSKLESKITSLQGCLEFKDSSLEKLENNLNVLTLENAELKNTYETSKNQFLSEIHESDILHAKCLKKLQDEKDDICSASNLLRQELSELLNENNQMSAIIVDLQMHLREAQESLECQKHKTEEVENTNQNLMVKKLELSKEVETVKADNLRLAELTQDLKNNLCLVENSAQLEKSRILDEQKKLLLKLESLTSDKEALEETCSMQESKLHLVTDILRSTKEELGRKVQDLETKLENYLELGSKYEGVLNENSFLKAEKRTSSNLLEELNNKVKDLTEMLNHQTEISNHEKKTVFNGLKLLTSENDVLDNLEAMGLSKAVECVFTKLNEQQKYFKELWEVEKQNVFLSEQKAKDLSNEIELVQSQNITLIRDIDKFETELQSLSITKNQLQALVKDHADKVDYYDKHIIALEDNIQALKDQSITLKETLDSVNTENSLTKESLNCYKTELEIYREEKRIAYLEINKMQNKISHVVKSIELLCRQVNCDCAFHEGLVQLDEESLDNAFKTIGVSYSLSANENTRLRDKIKELETELDSLKTFLKEAEHENTIHIAEQNINSEKSKLKGREGMLIRFASSVVESLASLKSKKDVFDVEEGLELESLMNDLSQTIAWEDYFSKIISVLDILILKLLESYGKAKQLTEIESRFSVLQYQERKYKLESELYSGELDYYKSENNNLLEEKLKLETDFKILKTERDNLAAELGELKNSFEKNAKLHELEINDLQSVVEMVSKAKDNLERDMVKERAEFVEKLDKSRFDCVLKSEGKISQLSSDLSSMEKTMAHLKDESRMHREEKELLQLRLMHLTRECQMQEKHINNLKEQLNLQTNQILESVKEHEETIKLLMELKMGQQLSREEQKGDIVRLEEEILRIESNISHSISSESLKVSAQEFQEMSTESEPQACSNCEALKMRNEQLLEEAASLKTMLAELRMENSNLFLDNKALDNVVGKQLQPLHRSFSRLSLQRHSPDLRNFAAWKSRESLAKAESESLGSLVSIDPRFSFDIPAEVVNLQERLVSSEKIIQQMHNENNFLREGLFSKQQEVTNNLESLIAKSKKKKGLLKMSTSEVNYDALTEITGQQLKILQEEKDELIKQVKDFKSQCFAAEQHMAQVTSLSEELRIERDSHRALSLAKEKLEVDLLKERLNVEREMREFQQFKEMLSKKERIESQIVTSGEQKSTTEQILGPYASSILKEEQKNLTIKIRRTIFLRDVAIQSGKSYLTCPARKSAQIYKQMVSSKSKEKSVVLDCGCVAELGTMKLKTGCRYHHLVEKMRRELKMQEMQNK